MIRINKIYLQLYDTPARYMVPYGGRRSGKSVAVSQLLVRRALENPGRRVVVMRKYATTIRLSVWPRMLAALDEAVGSERYKANKTDREIEVFNGSSFSFVGADDPQKMKSIEGVTDYWLEEANEFTVDDFDNLDAGLSAECTPDPQIWLTFNPIPNVPGYLHWIQERFLQVPHELGEIAVNGDAAVLRTYYRHNAFCPEKTKQVLERYKETNPALYKMWGLGEFTTLEGVILDGNWDIVDAVPEGIPLTGFGLDFGFANDPAAVIKVWQHNDDLYGQEIVYSSGLTNQALSAVMEEEGVRKSFDEIVGDSAEPKSIEELKQLGWLVVPSEKGPDYKRAAATYLRGLKIHILKGSSNLIKECATWSWKRDKQNNVMPVPADGNDHLIDALIYRTFSHKAIPRIRRI
jgi:phage terminase large subunit